MSKIFTLLLCLCLAEVDSLSKGQLGYVHIPCMSDRPYINVYE